MATEFTLSLVSGQNDYATCAGVYKKSVGTIREKIVWVNAPGDRVIFHNGNVWTISTTKSLVSIYEGATGGFYFAKNGPDDVTTADFSPRYTMQHPVNC